jgi:hypothetical protein
MVGIFFGWHSNHLSAVTWADVETYARDTTEVVTVSS